MVEAVRSTEGGWIATVAEIADWWDRRRNSRIVVDGDGRACVVGPAEGDGVVWHARIQESELKIDSGP